MVKILSAVLPVVEMLQIHTNEGIKSRGCCACHKEEACKKCSISFFYFHERNIFTKS